MIICYCGAKTNFELCCEPYINGVQKAPTAEKLMRSRYSAFATHAADYLIKTTAFIERDYQSKAEILLWATTNQWQKLEIIKATTTTVEFKAYFLDINKIPQVHHELSTFIQEDGIWYYRDGRFL